MKIDNLNYINLGISEVGLLKKKEMDTDEEVVRKALVKTWTKILEKYARKGAYIPSVPEVFNELYKTGVDAAVKAVKKEHWFVVSFMVRRRIEEKVKAGLERFDLAEFVEDVRYAQNDPALLNHLRQKIKKYVLEDF